MPHRRAPHGARGLKLGYFLRLDDDDLSRPARGAWIETRNARQWRRTHNRRAPHGARGLKLTDKTKGVVCVRRAPHGARGLKLCHHIHTPLIFGRAPHGARGLKFMMIYSADMEKGGAPL